MSVIEHYDKLIDENNDPVYDPEHLKKYMDKWDGQVFIDAMKLDKAKTVLEIGVGTGRLAVKTTPLCKEFFGIDISPKTIKKAIYNLSQYKNTELICADFMTYTFTVTFDVVYSSLTFMHIREKQKCINKIYSLLKLNGLFVLSIDKNQNNYIECGDRNIEIYPDDFSDTKAYITNSGLTLLEYRDGICVRFCCIKSIDKADRFKMNLSALNILMRSFLLPPFNLYLFTPFKTGNGIFNNFAVVTQRYAAPGTTCAANFV